MITEITDDGQTPLDPDEAAGLIPSWIATRGDLNVAEEENIREGQAWMHRVVSRRDVLTQDFLRELHKQMFGKVWRWAGTYRTTEKNIGVAPNAIATEIKNLFDDTQAWDEYNTYCSRSNQSQAKPRSWFHATGSQELHKFARACRAARRRVVSWRIPFTNGLRLRLTAPQ